MIKFGMTVLAEGRQLFIQEPAALGAMGIVAGEAVFNYGWMFPHKRAALVAMAFVAELVDALFLDHGLSHGAMGVVAGGALYLPLDDRMMREVIGQSPDILVTAETDLRFFCKRFRRVMHSVARNTGDIFLFV